ncbi:MAG: hypothetical protein NVSMB4_01600 [Acidimicrobiales bacterium]
MTIHFSDLIPGDRVMLPVRPDVPHCGPYVIRTVREFWTGVWEISFGCGDLVVTRHFTPADALRGALLAQTEEAA